MKNIKFPSAQTILLIIAGLVTLLTWLVPAGKYKLWGGIIKTRINLQEWR